MDGIGEIWVFSTAKGFEYPRRMILCKLLLRLDFGLGVLLPYGEHLEEGRGRQERVGSIFSHSIGGHVFLSFGECREGKLFAVGLSGGLVVQGIFVRVRRLGLLKLVHQIRRVGGAFGIGRMEPSADDLLDYVESHCT